MSVQQLMEEASIAYYAGEPTLSNEEYDALEAIHGQMISGKGDIKHAFRMFSLKKHYDTDGDLPLSVSECVKTVKLDGAAVSILYINGEFSHAMTRGDGVMGRDISTKVLSLGIPTSIETTSPIAQITGEVVASKDMENSRNYASGALNQKDLTVWEQRKTDGSMRFVAYNIQTVQNRWGIRPTYDGDMLELFKRGFNTVTCPVVYETGEDIIWEYIYPTDGNVFRISNNTKFNELGFTDRFPRGAIAHKDKQEAVITEILDVEWQCGKSGKVTPVAVLAPINIGGAIVARATLNNIAYIEALDLEIGCKVEVIRSGEIIPKIIGRVYEAVTEN